MRLLHVIDRVGLSGHGDWNAMSCAAFTRTAVEHEHVICLIGSNADERRAALLGIDLTDRLNPGAPGWPVALPGLRAFEEDRGPFDQVVIWTSRAHGTPRFGTRAPARLLTVAPTLDPYRRSWGRVRSLDDLSPESMPRLSAPIDDVEMARGQVRAQASIGDDDLVVAMVGHANDPRAAASFVFTLGLVEASGRPVVGLIAASPGCVGPARRLQRPTRLPRRLRFTNEPESIAMQGADVIVACPHAWRRHGDSIVEGRSEVTGASLASAAITGLPVVTPRTRRTEAIVDAVRTEAVLTTNAAMIEVARGIMTALTRVGTSMNSGVSPHNHENVPFAEAIVDHLVRHDALRAPTMS